MELFSYNNILKILDYLILGGVVFSHIEGSNQAVVRNDTLKVLHTFLGKCVHRNILLHDLCLSREVWEENLYNSWEEDS